MKLRAEEERVLGSLMEKALTTPQQYPLTLASLVSACNQATNREPVVSYDEDTVMSALDDLKAQRLVRFVLPSSGRTAVRFRHIVDETLALDTRQCALVSVLLLRGPQTIGELRLRTDRMTEFNGLDEVQHELDLLSELEEPLAANHGRRPGQKEERWICPYGEVTTDAGLSSSIGGEAVHDDSGWTGFTGSLDEGDTHSVPSNNIGDIREEVAALQAEVRDLRRDLDELRTNLGG
jgi:hypothetical protein